MALAPPAALNRSKVQLITASVACPSTESVQPTTVPRPSDEPLSCVTVTPPLALSVGRATAKNLGMSSPPLAERECWRDERRYRREWIKNRDRHIHLLLYDERHRNCLLSNRRCFAFLEADGLHPNGERHLQRPQR